MLCLGALAEFGSSAGWALVGPASGIVMIIVVVSALCAVAAIISVMVRDHFGSIVVAVLLSCYRVNRGGRSPKAASIAL